MDQKTSSPSEIFGDQNRTFLKAYFLDGFCGAGGASLGITLAGQIRDDKGNVVGSTTNVAIAVNHDPRAIWAHNANHPETIHLNSDIQDVDLADVARQLKARGIRWINIWWSAECTHFSNAKGGASRDADSRMLSEQLIRYIAELEANGIEVHWVFVENVREFFGWCPLLPKRLKDAPAWKDGHARWAKLEKRYARIQIGMFDAVATGDKDLRSELSKEMDLIYTQFQNSGLYEMDAKRKVTMLPDPDTKGLLYLRWHEAIERMGYQYDWRMLNAADLGAYQSRERYFGVFVRKDIAKWIEAEKEAPIKFPAPTHAKNPNGKGTLFDAGVLKPWEPCRKILQLDDRGESIFYGRRIKRGKRKGQPMPRLVQPTLDRIGYGVVKFKDQGTPVEMVDRGGYNRTPASVDSVAPTVMSCRNQGLVTAMIDRTHTDAIPTDVESPMPTVRASYANGVVQVDTVDSCTFGADQQDLDSPLSTVMAKRDKYKATTFIVPSNYSNGPVPTCFPLPTVMASRKHNYLCTPFFAHSFSSDGKANQVSSCNAPLWSVMPNPKAGLILPFMVSQYGQSKATGCNEPIGCLTANPKYSLNVAFLSKYYGTGENVTSMDSPTGTVTTNDRFGITQCRFLNYYNGGGQGNSDKRNTSLDSPVNTIGTHHLPTYINCHFALYYHGGKGAENRVHGLNEPVRAIATENWPNTIHCQFINYNYGGHNSAAHNTSTHAPVNTIGTGFTPTLLHCALVPEISEEIILEWAPDFYKTKRGNWISGHWGKARAINGYWVSWNILDIHYRMLKVSELKLAQGFPESYVLDPDSETVAKKHIGNAVHVKCAEELVKINCGPGTAYMRWLAHRIQQEDLLTCGKSA